MTAIPNAPSAGNPMILNLVIPVREKTMRTEPIPSTKAQMSVTTILMQVNCMTKRAADLGCAIAELRDDVEPRFRVSDISSDPSKRTDDHRWLEDATKDTRASVSLLIREYICTRDALFALYHQPIELLED